MSTYKQSLLKSLQEKLSAHNIAYEKIPDGLMVYIEINNVIGRVAVCVLPLENHTRVACVLPIRKNAMIIESVVELAEQLNEELLKISKNYSRCFINNVQNTSLMISRFPPVLALEEIDVNELFSAILDVSSLCISIIETINKRIDKKVNDTQNNSDGCYIATAIYGSYDCPQVWTLRRYRDFILAKTWYGRIFIKIYYLMSPKFVKRFGETKWFKCVWARRLNGLVSKLQQRGIESTPYEDRKW